MSDAARLAELRRVAEEATGTTRVNWSPDDALWVLDKLYALEGGSDLSAKSICPHGEEFRYCLLCNRRRVAKLERLLEEQNGLQGHDAPCYYCGKPCNSLAGDPGQWPVALCHEDEPGVVKWHHTGCVSDRLRKLAAAESACREHELTAKRWDWLASWFTSLCLNWTESKEAIVPEKVFKHFQDAQRGEWPDWLLYQMRARAVLDGDGEALSDEDEADLADAREALKEPGDSVPWEDVKKRLGLAGDGEAKLRECFDCERLFDERDEGHFYDNQYNCARCMNAQWLRDGGEKKTRREGPIVKRAARAPGREGAGGAGE